jgi:hypothetical protein
MLPISRVFHDVEIFGQKPRSTRRMMLESARKLGAKWGAREFVEMMTNVLVAEGIYPEAVYIEPLVINKPSPHLDITEFRQNLSFCLPRW